MTYEVVITDSALEKVKEQFLYIATDQQSPEAARRWLEKVVEASETLAEVPRRCALAPEDQYRPYEVPWLAVGEFLLLFTVVDEDNTVYVIGARHGRRLPRPAELPPLQRAIRDTRGMLAGETSLTDELLEERRREREREER